MFSILFAIMQLASAFKISLKVFAFGFDKGESKN